MTQTQAAENEGVVTQLQRQIDAGSESIARMDEDIRTFTRERPMVATIAALGLGYVIGRVVSKWF